MLVLNVEIAPVWQALQLTIAAREPADKTYKSNIVFTHTNEGMQVSKGPIIMFSSLETKSTRTDISRYLKIKMKNGLGS